MTQNYKIKPLHPESALSFAAFWTVALYLITHNLIPYIVSSWNLRPVIAWFLSAGLLIFVPLFFLSFSAILKEGNKFDLKTISQRFRIRKLNKKDWQILTFAAIFNFPALFLIQIFYNGLSELTGLFPALSTSPSFMTFEPLKTGEYWILLLWFPFFFFNIIGEELYWHGYFLPAQQLVHGKITWIINGSIWMMFHLSFGIGMMIMLIPLIYSISYLVQKRENLMFGIILHGLINGSGFLLLAWGVI